MLRSSPAKLPAGLSCLLLWGCSQAVAPLAGCSKGSAKQEAPDLACKLGSRGGTAYWFCGAGRTFEEARSRCAAVGMALAAIEDEAEGDFLRSQITAASRIGLSDVARAGVWRWTMSGALSTCAEPFPPSSTDYTNWASGEPRQATVSAKAVSDEGRCAWLGATNDATWTTGMCHTPLGYICEALPRDGVHAVSFNQVAAELEDARLQRPSQQGRQQRSGAKLSARADFAQIFNREQARFGLRPCLDTLVRGETWKIEDLGQEETPYQQHYKGLRVVGAAFYVRRDIATGEVRSLTNHLVSNLSLSTEVRVRREIALTAAVAWIRGQLSDYDPGLGTLYVFPISQGPWPRYGLVWEFELPPAGKLPGYSVAISAADGELIHRLSDIVQ